MNVVKTAQSELADLPRRSLSLYNDPRALFSIIKMLLPRYLPLYWSLESWCFSHTMFFDRHSYLLVYTLHGRCKIAGDIYRFNNENSDRVSLRLFHPRNQSAPHFNTWKLVWGRRRRKNDSARHFTFATTHCQMLIKLHIDSPYIAIFSVSCPDLGTRACTKPGRREIIIICVWN